MASPRCVKYCQGKPTRRLFIPFNQRNQPPTRSLAMIHRSSRTEISNSSGNSPASNYEIEWPAFESVREKKKGSDRGSNHIASPLEKSFRVTLTQETPQKYARAYFPIYFHIYKRVTSAHGSFAAMFN